MNYWRKWGVVVLVFTLVLGMSVSGTASAFPGRGRPSPPGRAQGTIDGYSDDEGSEQDDPDGWVPPGLRNKGVPPGLQDKGGLPPGLQDREVLPPGIQLRFAETLRQRFEEEEGAEEETAALIIEGPEFVVIPEEGKQNATYRAIFHDGQGEQEVQAEWALLDAEAIDGVTINEDGVLHFDESVESASITVTAEYLIEDEETTRRYDASLEVELYRAEPHSLHIEGQEYVLLDDELGDEEMTLSYSAVMRDQHGIAMESGVIEWVVTTGDFDEEEMDILADAQDLDIILDAAKEGVIEVTARSEAEEDLADHLTVSLYYPEKQGIEILGDALVQITDDMQFPLELVYQAHVVDQYDRIVDAVDVTWSIQSDSEGVTVDGGVVSVAQIEGDALEFALQAEHDEYSDQLDVVVYYPEANSVSVTGPGSIEIPEEGEVSTAKFEADVIDQNGETIPSVDVMWLVVDEEGGSLRVEDGVQIDEEGYLTVEPIVTLKGAYVSASYDEDTYELHWIDFVSLDESDED